MFLKGYKRLYPRNSEQRAVATTPEDRRKMENENFVDRDSRTHFKAGIDESLAKKLKMLLSSRKDLVRKDVPKQVLYVTDEGNRFEMDDKSKKLTCEKKNKFKSCEISLLSHDYDLRIACATENKTALSQTIEECKGGFTMERHKYRTSYEKPNNSGFWKIDFTEVISHSLTTSSSASSTSKKNGSSTTSTYSFADAQEKGKKEEQEQAREYELEFELKPEALKFWLTCDDKVVKGDKPETEYEKEKEKVIHEVTSRLWMELMDFLKYCIPSWMDTKEEIMLSPVQLPSSMENKIRELNNVMNPSLFHPGRGLEGRIEFLGSMPINLFRSSLNIVLQSDYYLTEKTDGVRYLFYIMRNESGNGNICFFMNRSIKYFTVPNGDILANLFPPSTVLDGEIVFNINLKKSIFLIFDILCYDSKSKIDLPFIKRYECIKQEVIHRYDQTREHFKKSYPDFRLDSLLLCHYKRFLPKKDISTLLKCFHEESGERIYRDDNVFRSDHKTDGIIFQPNVSYKVGKCYDLLKWKWSDLRSVDLQVFSRSSYFNIQNLHLVSASELFLKCTGPDGSLIDISKRGDYNVGLSEYDTARLLAESEELGQSKLSSLIIEVIYDTTIGKWIYSKIRNDKKDPNYIDSVLGVFIEQAEAITIEELEYTILSSVLNFEYDYSTRLVKAKNTLLEWQRKGRK
jgi:hypothetical protein